MRWITGEAADSDRYAAKLIEYRDETRRWFLLQLREDAGPEALLKGAEDAETFIDAPDELGPWRQGHDLAWRGVGLRCHHRP